MVLISAATSWEARPFLKEYFGEEYLLNDYPLEVDKGKFLVVIGIGGKKAKKRLEKIALDVSCIINVGVAGSLDPLLAKGEILRVDKIYSRGEMIEFKPYFNDFLNSLNSAELESHALPVLWKSEKKARRIVDMEGAALAGCCPDLPHAFVKIVFDYCSFASFIASMLFHQTVIQKSLLRAFEGVIWG